MPQDGKIICNTGDAAGADAMFAAHATNAGHKVVRWSPYFNPEALKQADQFVFRANTTLKRTFPSASEHTNNLLRRNYWQVRDTKAVFAVARLSDRGIKGGTAWAVQMAIDLRVPTVYLFDMNANMWNQWYYSMWKWDYVLSREMHKPSHFIVYTGIGSRVITQKAINAIGELYAK